MPLSVFLERGSPPTEGDLREAMGRASGLWDQLHAALSRQFTPLGDKWSYAGKAYGWSLQLKHKKRTILYMIPCRGHFVASLALGDKACLAARTAGLPAVMLELIERAPKYPEGRGVRVEVKTKKDLLHVTSLAALRMAN